MATLQLHRRVAVKVLLKSNLLFEYVPNIEQGQKRSDEHILSSGFRQAIEIGCLELVPGIGMPVRLSSNGEVHPCIFLYPSLGASFLRPFWMIDCRNPDNISQTEAFRRVIFFGINIARIEPAED